MFYLKIIGRLSRPILFHFVTSFKCTGKVEGSFILVHFSVNSDVCWVWTRVKWIRMKNSELFSAEATAGLRLCVRLTPNDSLVGTTPPESIPGKNIFESSHLHLLQRHFAKRALKGRDYGAHADWSVVFMRWHRPGEESILDFSTFKSICMLRASFRAVIISWSLMKHCLHFAPKLKKENKSTTAEL